MEDLRDVVLVGHSCAGFLISLLAERMAERLRQLVYLDAFVPEDGPSVLDFIQPPERRAALRESARATGFAAPVPLTAQGVTRSEDLARALPRMVPQPFATFERPVRLTGSAGNGPARDYVACTRPASGHDVMIIDPALLAGLLLDIVDRPARATGARGADLAARSPAGRPARQ